MAKIKSLKGANVKKEERKETKSFVENFEGKLKKHIEEPLFVIAIIAILISIIKPILNFPFLSIIILLLGVLSVYFVYVYFKNDIKNYYFILIPVLIFCIALFSFYADQYNPTNNFNESNAFANFTAFSIMFAIILLFYSLWVHKIIRELRHALIAAIFICTLLTHMMAALNGEVAELDPYFHYRMADYITETENVMEHDSMVYPPEGVDRSSQRLMVAVFMASNANFLNPLGFATKDAAILWPGVIAAFTVLVLYLLIRDLFSEMKPYNYVAALLAAFMLMLNPAFAQHAIAGNCEDDALGMFLIVSSFLLMMLAFRRRSLKITILAGFSFLMLNLTYDAYAYAAGPVIGVFIGIYALVNFIHKKNAVRELPYFVIPILISFLAPLILHARGELPVFTNPGYIILIPIGGAFLFSVILEIIRSHMYGRITIPEKTIEDKMENLIDKYIFPIGIAGIIIGMIFMLSFPVVPYMESVIVGTEVRDIIGLTTAEQIRTVFTPQQLVSYACCSQSGFSGTYGVAFLFAIPMILVLSYFALARRSMGAAFILAWGVPMIYGVYTKPQYTFVASVSTIALGATVGLLAGVTRKDLEGWKIITTILIILIPLTYIPFAGMDHYSKLGTSSILYTGSRSAGSDVWMPALLWLGNQTIEGSNTTWSTIAWWDYGHWIAAISKRVAVADNAKNNPFTVQDDAKFHVLVKTEEEALDITRKYNAQYVAIDWTMVGKSHAPHFIATSNITTLECGFSQYGYGQLVFNPAFRYGQNSEDVCDSTKEQWRLNEENNPESTKCLGFVGNAYGIWTILFNIKNNERISSIYVVTYTGDKIPWETWRDKHNVSILGVHPLNAILGWALQGQLNNLAGNPTMYNTLVYAPNEFDDGKSGRYPACERDNSYYTKYSYAYHNYSDYMLTKLYLGDHADTYYNVGLCTTDWCKNAAENGTSSRLKYFKLVDEFDGVGAPDYSNGGYVRVYEIIYPEEIEEEKEEATGGILAPSDDTKTLVTWE